MKTKPKKKTNPWPPKHPKPGDTWGAYVFHNGWWMLKGGFWCRLVPEDDWRPIESAPKDGTEVLLMSLKTENISSGFFHPKHLVWVWLSHGVPTHWRPLPKLPKGEA